MGSAAAAGTCPKQPALCRCRPPLCVHQQQPRRHGATAALTWTRVPAPCRPATPTVWATAKFGHISPPLLEAITAQAVQVPPGAHTLQELANLLYGFAIMGHCPSSLLLRLAAEAGQRLGEWAPPAPAAGAQG